MQDSDTDLCIRQKESKTQCSLTRRAWCCAANEGWEDHTVPMPEFRSEEAMRDFLPPQLLAALALAKVTPQHPHTLYFPRHRAALVSNLLEGGTPADREGEDVRL